MNLTPIASDRLPGILQGFAARLAPGSLAARAFARIAATAEGADLAADTPGRRDDALGLVRRFAIPAVDEAPAASFSWDGRSVRTRSEPSVLIHEVAHWLIAPPGRRALPDFGLGAGPETGRVAAADAARCVDPAAKEEEELLASLLGILWEAELGHPAIHAFVEQNWLEGWERPAAAAQFVRAAGALRARGLIDADGAPYAGSAATAAISIRNSGQASAETSTMAEAGPSLGK